MAASLTTDNCEGKINIVKCNQWNHEGHFSQAVKLLLIIK